MLRMLPRMDGGCTFLDGIIPLPQPERMVPVPHMSTDDIHDGWGNYQLPMGVRAMWVRHMEKTMGVTVDAADAAATHRYVVVVLLLRRRRRHRTIATYSYYPSIDRPVNGTQYQQ